MLTVCLCNKRIFLSKRAFRTIKSCLLYTYGIINKIFTAFVLLYSIYRYIFVLTAADAALLSGDGRPISALIIAPVIEKGRPYGQPFPM